MPPKKVKVQLDEEDDDPQEDPMVDLVKNMATKEERLAKKRMDEALKKAATEEKQRELENRKLDVEKEKLEMERMKEMHKKHVEMEKLRLEQQKQFAKASRAADEVKADLAASQYDSVDKETKAKDDAMRKVGLLQQRLGARGTGRRLTAASPLKEWILELEICNSQLNLERASDVPEQMLYGVMKLVEEVARPAYNIDGLTDDFKAAVQASREADPGSFDSHLDRAMLQCSIKYSHLFAVSPELYVAGSILKLAQQRHHKNEVARGEAIDKNMSSLVEEEFNKMMEQ